MSKLESVKETMLTMNNGLYLSKETMNNGNNDKGMWKTRKMAADEAEYEAEVLVKKLNAPHCRKFFLKCVYHLSEAEIQEALEYAMRPRVACPVKYFNTICKSKLTRAGY